MGTCCCRIFVTVMWFHYVCYPTGLFVPYCSVQALCWDLWQERPVPFLSGLGTHPEYKEVRTSPSSVYGSHFRNCLLNFPSQFLLCSFTFWGLRGPREHHGALRPAHTQHGSQRTVDGPRPWRKLQTDLTREPRAWLTPLEVDVASCVDGKDK